MVMKQLLLFLCSASIAITPMLVRSASADNSATQEGWRQPYSPTRLEWLVVKLTSDRKPCVGREVDGKPSWVAFYEWSQVSDDEVILTVRANRDDLKYCASLAFDELQAQSAKFQLNPPTVELKHILLGSSTPTTIVWTCSVPAKIDKNTFVDFERVCRVK
jgi:hypothetical protein